MKKLLLILLCLPMIFSCGEKKKKKKKEKDDNISPAKEFISIGDTHQGGIIFHLDGNGGGLIAEPSKKPQFADWGCKETSRSNWAAFPFHYDAIAGANGKAIGTGAQNTLDIEAGCTTSGTAADICANLTINGYSDWFLPSKDELNEMYVNLHTQGFGGFSSERYWSSTQSQDKGAWIQDFFSGSQNPSGYGKRIPGRRGLYVRAVRAFGNLSIISGCTDSTMFNYNYLATEDDSSCISIVNGCTDIKATNYNSLATVDNDSCTYFSVVIGDILQGGIVFYLDGNGGGLIAAPSDHYFETHWGCSYYSILGAGGKAIGTGAQNTLDIEAGCTESGTAADICANLTLNGYSDWFLPSKDELNEMYLNITAGNHIGQGGFVGRWYWSSTEFGNSTGDYKSQYSWAQNLNNGNQNKFLKRSESISVRAIRAF